MTEVGQLPVSGFNTSPQFRPAKAKIAARVKWKVYKVVLRPAMLYGLATMSLETGGGDGGGRVEDVRF